MQVKSKMFRSHDHHRNNVLNSPIANYSPLHVIFQHIVYKHTEPDI